MALKPYERGFIMDPNLEDKMGDLFEDVITDGGLLAVRNILDILVDSTGLVGEMAKDDGTEAGDERMINWGRSLMKAANRIKQLSKTVIPIGSRYV